MLSRICVTLLILLFVSGCATAPKKYDFNPVCSLEGSYDEVWNALVEYFAIANLPINTIEKDSGLIVTSWMDASSGAGSEDKTICDCGGSGIAIPQWSRGKFSVFVKVTPSGTVDLRVTCTYQQGRKFMDAFATVVCESTGHLENNIHEYVRARATGLESPDIPIFSPGHEQ